MRRQRLESRPCDLGPARRLLAAPVLFWTCLNPDHRDVTWTGDTATCPDCGLTSQMTSHYDQRVRANERAKAADDLEAHAKKLMEAGTTKIMNDEPGGFNGALRAATVNYAARYLRGET